MLETPAHGSEIAQAIRHVFGADAPLEPQHLRLSAVPPLREVYAAIIETDEFCAACGRISASYAW